MPRFFITVLASLILTGCYPNQNRVYSNLPRVECIAEVSPEELTPLVDIIEARIEPDGPVRRWVPMRNVETQATDYIVQRADQYMVWSGGFGVPGRFDLSLYPAVDESAPTDEELLAAAGNMVAGLDLCEPYLRDP